MKKIVLLAVGLSSYGMAFSQTGTPVATFGTNGQTSLPYNYSQDMAIQPNGKIVVLGRPNISPGNDDFGVARINTDGTLDNTFGSGGYATTGFYNDDRASKLALQADGRIVIVGEVYNGSTTDMVVVRYLSNGTLDNNFGSGGKLTLGIAAMGWGAAVAVQSDGKIVVAGALSNNNCIVARLNTDGSYDNSFGTAGKKVFTTGIGTRDISTIKMLPDGKIVLGGSGIGVSGDFMVARLLPDGNLDTGLNGSGIAMADMGGQDDGVKSLTIDENGNYLLSGYVWDLPGSYYGWGAARFTSSGTLDNSFGSGGKLIPSIQGQANAVAVQSDKKIIVAGHSITGFTANLFINRYNADGTPDLSFDGDGTVTGSFSSSTISALTLWGDRIYALGNFDGVNAVLALQNDATPLPLTLTSFTASQESAVVTLQWQTAMERNTSHFEVERSVDGKHFTRIAEVPATGTNATLLTYTYADRHPAGPVNQYRLKMVDQDGKFSYSKIVVVRTEAASRLQAVYPNPASTRLQLPTALQGNLHICFYNSKGQLVKALNATSNGMPLTVNVSDLLKGIYQVVISGKGKRETATIVKE